MIKKLINSVSDFRYKKRQYDMFDYIFEIFPQTNNLCLTKIIDDFSKLIMESKGIFYFETESLYLFEDKRFFIPLKCLLRKELLLFSKIIHSKGMIPKGKKIDRFTFIIQSFNEIEYNFNLTQRKKLLIGFFLYFYNHLTKHLTKHLNDENIQNYQYSIILLKDFLYAVTNITKVYNDIKELKFLIFEIKKQINIVVQKWIIDNNN